MPKPKPIKPQKYSAGDIMVAIQGFIVPRLDVKVVEDVAEHELAAEFLLALNNGQQFTIEVLEV